jgi:2-amino-4-hydroxy-6-hydroxymethyldihydropteridine diphosphokinase
MKDEGGRRRGFLSLGSNLGERRENLRRAITALEECGRIEVRRVSRVYETAPIGVTHQPDFFNLAAEIETDLTARELLVRLKDIERDLGREPGLRWGARLIDIDILLLGEEEITEADLTIPHPRMLERAFVMAPLAELQPGLLFGEERADEIAARLAMEQGIGGDFPL